MFNIPFSYWASSEPVLQNVLVTGNGSATPITFNGVTVNRGILKMNSNGVVDTTFNSGGTGVYNASAIVCARPQSTGKIVCLFNVNSASGVYNSGGVNYTGLTLMRLNANGTFDTSFTRPSVPYTGAGLNSLNGGNNTALIILDDDSIVVYNESDSEIQKFPADGAPYPTTAIAFNGIVSVIRKTADNKIFATGRFTYIYDANADYYKNRMIRLNSDLTVDTSFNIGPGLNANSLSGLEVQSDGKIIIGGSFTTVNGSTRNYITRQYQDGVSTGVFDSGYIPTITSSAFSTVYARTGIQSDGKLLSNNDQVIGGLSFNGTFISGGAMYRVNTDGSLDTGFTRLAPNNRVLSFAQLNNSKILVASLATTLGGVSTTSFYRLNADGTKDNTFSMTGASTWNRNITIL